MSGHEIAPSLLKSPDASAALGPGWRTALWQLAVAVGLVILLFYPTAWSMVSIWARSETFAHGFLIVPISLWLIWERRAGLRLLQPAPSFLPLLLMLPFGLGWLLGDLADVNVVRHFAFVGMLVSAIWAVLGPRVSGYLAFPVLFLFFAVPAGEGLVYPMMGFTADFTVGMLKLTGIPVYREGMHFAIPTGRWSVVEACSGVRYLIASVTLGALFAYLTYSRWWKRALFMVLAILVPILANGLRAYMIVMIGHLSGMTLAVGVDHLIYGWVFFGVVVAIMFLLGSLFRDPPAPLPLPTPVAASGGGPGARSNQPWQVLAVLLAAAAIWPVLGWSMADRSGTVAGIDLTAPAGVAGWGERDDAQWWTWRPRVLGADGSLYRFYARGADQVGLYLGVYRTQRQGAELVGSGNQMVDPEQRIWTQLAMARRRIEVDQHRFSVDQHSLVANTGERLLVWTWYRVGDRHTANPYLAKLIESLTRLVGQRGEAALIAVATPYQQRTETAEATLQAFVTAMLPGIDAEIERAVAAP